MLSSEAKEFKEKFEEAATINAKLFGIEESGSKEGEKAEKKEGSDEKTEKDAEKADKESKSTEAGKTETSEESKDKEKA